MINLTEKAIAVCTNCRRQLAKIYLGSIKNAAKKYEINTTHRLAAWLANISEESGQLEILRENLSYSAKGLARVWPNRFAKKGSDEPNELAISIQYHPEKIANIVYANRLGNGDEQSGDGWRYRGIGFIQITGKSNIIETLNVLGFKTDNPDILENPTYAFEAAAYFFKSRGCNELSDLDSFDKIVKKINGQSPCSANNGDERIKLYTKGLQFLSNLK